MVIQQIIRTHLMGQRVKYTAGYPISEGKDHPHDHEIRLKGMESEKYGGGGFLKHYWENGEIISDVWIDEKDHDVKVLVRLDSNQYAEFKVKWLIAI